MELKLLLLFHLLGAAIWTGGHLILVIGFLPTILRSKNIELLTTYEYHFERVGIPALLTQLITGLRLAYIYVPSFSDWFSFKSSLHTLISIKLLLFITTIGLAIHARFFIIPTLTIKSLNKLVYHIVTVTLVGVLFVLIGSSFRSGLVSF